MCAGRIEGSCAENPKSRSKGVKFWCDSGDRVHAMEGGWESLWVDLESFHQRGLPMPLTLTRLSTYILGGKRGLSF